MNKTAIKTIGDYNITDTIPITIEIDQQLCQRIWAVDIVNSIDITKKSGEILHNQSERNN